MPRPPLRLALTALLICLSFTLFISMIQAQPYDTGELQAVLGSPPPCPKPCWQQIRPGVSSAEDAIRLLQQNQWVDDISAADDVIEWRWSGQQPRLINPDEPGRIFLKNQHVYAISIPLKAHLGDLYFLYGSPHWNSTGHGQGQAQLSLTYPSEYLKIAVYLDCPASRTSLWQSQPFLQFQTSSQNGLALTSLANSRHLGC